MYESHEKRTNRFFKLRKWNQKSLILVLFIAALGFSLYAAAQVPLIGPERMMDDPMAGIPSNAQTKADIAYFEPNDMYLAVWVDDRNGKSNIVGVRIDPTGNVLDTDGILIADSTDPLALGSPTVSAGGNGWLVVWENSELTYPDHALYATIINPGGSVSDPNGNSLCSPPDQRAPSAAFSWDGPYERWLVTWDQDLSGTRQIYGALVDWDGDLLNCLAPISANAGDDQREPDVVYDGNDWLVVWEDSRGGDSDIYGHKMATDGNPVGSELAIIVEPGDQVTPAVASDEDDYLLVFAEHPCEEHYWIVARILDAGGTPGPFIEPFSRTDLSRPYPAVDFDGSHYFVSWSESRNDNYDVFGGWVDASGELLDPFGIHITSGPADELSPNVASRMFVYGPPETPKHESMVVYQRFDAGLQVERVFARTGIWDGGSLDFIEILPGTFTMGSPDSPEPEPCREPDEEQHQVTLTHYFEIMSKEATQGQFEALMEYNPSHFSQCGTDCPVERVTWFDALAYSNLLSMHAGLQPCYVLSGVDCEDGASGIPPDYCKDHGGIVHADSIALNGVASVYDCEGYRLPTEAEWEYATRAGSTTAFYNGQITDCDCDDPNLDQIAWYCGNDTEATHPGGRKIPNDWGLYDASGNVKEWVWDCYDWDYGIGGPDPVIDPEGPVDGQTRVARGGGHADQARGCRSAHRDALNSDYIEQSLGFRLARTLARATGFVPVPAGTFEMGDSETLPPPFEGQTIDPHTVTLTHDFEAMTSEVTQGMFISVMDYNPSQHFIPPNDTDDCPVEQVSWFDAAAYTIRLSEQSGLKPCYVLYSIQCASGSGSENEYCKDNGGISSAGIMLNDVGSVYECEGYRLPTEAEWEYAARAGSLTDFYNGEMTEPTSCSPSDPNLDLIGWYECNSNYQTHPAGPLDPVLEPNDWGLYDTSGNVNEWVWDGYYEYPPYPVQNPEHFPSGTQIYRGGGFPENAIECRSAWRSGGVQIDTRTPILGFRVVRSLLAPSCNGCEIDGFCHGNYSVNPSNPCEYCNTEVSTIGWTYMGDGATCEDGLFCTANRCEDGECEEAGSACDDNEICTVDGCDEDNDICIHDPAPMDFNPCDDDLFCTVDEYCLEGTCGNGDANDCDDGSECTVDTCLEEEDICDNDPYPLHGTECDDGLFCTVNDHCDWGVCEADPRDCSDGEFCTVDLGCNEDIDACEYDPFWMNGAPCDDGLFCNGTDTCQDGSCHHPGDPCDDGVFCNGTEDCIEDGDYCMPSSGDPCNDGVFCNGTEDCDEGGDQCLSSSGNPCQTDNCETCDEDNDECDPLISGPCDDGLFCTGTDSCFLGFCSIHSGNPCDDGVDCTSNNCVEFLNTCTYTPEDSYCDDGEFCNGAETCDPDQDCQAGTDPCPDNGLFCDGTEYCDEAGDQCLSTGDPCDPVTQICNEDEDICDDLCPAGNLCATVYLHGFWDGSQHTCATTVDIDLYSDPGQPADYSFIDVSLASDGAAQVDLATESVAPGSYYVVVRHYNHLDLITASAHSWDGTSAVQVDFSVLANVDHGQSALKNDKSTWCMPGGDATGDNRVNLADYGRLLSNWNGQNQGADFNCDGFCRLSDYPILLGTWNMQSYAP